MLVGSTLETAYLLALSKYSERQKKWITGSSVAGGKFPETLLMLSIQRLGNIDCLLCSLEDEFINSNENERRKHLMLFELQSSLSSAWIGNANAVLQVLKKDADYKGQEYFTRLVEDIRRVRVQIEKHEIAGDKYLTDPLILHKLDSQGNASDGQLYRKTKDGGGFIPRTGISKNGSIMWEVFSVKDSSTYWLERRKLALDVINCLSQQ